MHRYRITEIKLNIGESESALPSKIKAGVMNRARRERHGKPLYLGDAKIEDIEIVRRAIDARKSDVRWVLTVDFSCNKVLNLPEPPDLSYEIPVVNANANANAASENPPLIIGFGPCGMFCALVLARAGLNPLVLERGLDVDTRIQKVDEFWKSGKLDPECNVQFGEGGAGTFSDGKLNTGIKDPRIRFVLRTFVQAGADKDILIDARPHIGTDKLRNIVKNIREEIISLGGEVRFNSKVESLILGDSPGVRLQGGEELFSDHVVLALGHSARDTVRSLYSQGLSMEPKAFSMGVRVEHPQELIDRGMYGNHFGNPDLPPAYYKLISRASDGRGVYSFCMCPGGEIVNAASQIGGVVTNGMSNHLRDSGYANSGILVDVRPEDYINQDYIRENYIEVETPDELSGLLFQEYYEHLAFVNGGSDYSLPTTTWEEFNESDQNPVVRSLPDFVARGIREAIPVFGKRIQGFDSAETTIKAVESRSSSPVRILRDRDSLESVNANFCGVYPGGEGAGYAGGITSAACDGIKIAEKIISKIIDLNK